jgi:hypothetical protein
MEMMIPGYAAVLTEQVRVFLGDSGHHTAGAQVIAELERRSS